MLPVGVKRQHGVEAVVQRVPEAGPQRGTLALVGDLADHLGPRRLGVRGRVVGRAVVHDEHLEVPPSDVVVLEGVGAGHPGFAGLVTLPIWVEAPERVRLARGLERDGAELEPHWRRWLVAERRLHARERTRDRADVVLDGTRRSVAGL